MASNRLFPAFMKRASGRWLFPFFMDTAAAVVIAAVRAVRAEFQSRRVALVEFMAHIELPASWKIIRYGSAEYWSRLAAAIRFEALKAVPARFKARKDSQAEYTNG